MYTVPLIVVVPWANPRLLNQARRRNSSTIFFGITCLWLHTKPEIERVERLDGFMRRIAPPSCPSTLFVLISRATEVYEQALEERHANSSNIGDLVIEISETGRKNGSESLKRDGLDQTGK